MDQAGYTFYPPLLTVQQGQPVEFRNSEDVLHNVRVTNSETHEVAFNVATSPFGSYAHTFEKAGYYNVTCDVHTAMSASILVTTTPYAAVAGDEGRFSFGDVPYGRYAVVIDAGERIERAIEVAGPRIEVDVSRKP